jgi:CheY-like chemotaxis protein
MLFTLISKLQMRKKKLTLIYMMSKVLMIEDDPLLQNMYKVVFTKAGFDFQFAGDGREGLDKMRVYKPDIVLLDLILPVMTGFSVLDVVNRDPVLKTIPIIVMTNIYADAEDLIKNRGVKSFIIKSDVSIEDVVQKVENVIASSNTQPPPVQ